jgi:hypothetical protein
VAGAVRELVAEDSPARREFVYGGMPTQGLWVLLPERHRRYEEA